MAGPIELGGLEDGFSGVGLGRISSWMRELIVARKLAGLEVLLVRRGCVAFHACEGMADLERGVPATPETLYRIYSMSKPLTSLAAMMLFEDGLFELDGPIADFLPAFSKPRIWSDDGCTVPAARGITFRDLLTHRSGLTYGFMNENAVDALYREQRLGDLGSTLTLAAFVDRLAKLPLLSQPGARWNYSHSTDVLAHLIEVISGQSFDDFLCGRLFRPLGMSDTSFHVPAGRECRLAACYLRAKDGTIDLQDDPRTSHFLAPTLAPFGGAIISTASDYMKFCSFILGYPESNTRNILGRPTIDLMLENQLDGDIASVGPERFGEMSCKGLGFGLGFSVLLDSGMAKKVGSVGECGWGGIASTAFWVDRKEQLSAVLMTQLMPSTQNRLRNELRELVYQALDHG